MFLAMMLADLGAEVILISRPQRGMIDTHETILNRKKKSIMLDLKNSEDQQILKDLIRISDVFVDPYKPGTLERLCLSPEDCFGINPNLIFARVSSFGQKSLKAGHDINFLATSGILSFLTTKEGPVLPSNLIGDFASGALLSCIGILAAL